MDGAEKKRWMKHIDFLLSDILCIEIAFVLAYMMKNGWKNLLEVEDYRHIAVILLVLPICITFFTEPYSGILRRGWLREFVQTVKDVCILMALLFGYMFVLKITDHYSRLVISTFAVMAVAVLYAGRCLNKYLIRRRQERGKTSDYLVLVCEKKDAKRVAEKLLINQYGPLKLSGIVLADITTGSEAFSQLPKQISGVPVVAVQDTMMEYFRTHVVDDVMLHLKTENVTDLAKQLVIMGMNVHVKINQIFDEKLKCTADRINGISVLTATMKQISSGQLFLKRAMDICGGVVGAVLTGIIFLFIAPVIYIQSPGPVFFSQKRVGKNGRTFKIYKFRSMYLDAEERKKELMEQNKMNGFMFKMDHDPRIFPFGNFIRKTSLDEFPQFINVLKGDMSLVGTRPPTLDEYEQYELHHKGRLAMKPGLTGMWQVSGRSDITDFEEVVRLDTEYIRNWSLSLDIKILLKTVMMVFAGKGAE